MTKLILIGDTLQTAHPKSEHITKPRVTLITVKISSNPIIAAIQARQHGNITSPLLTKDKGTWVHIPNVDGYADLTIFIPESLIASINNIAQAVQYAGRQAIAGRQIAHAPTNNTTEHTAKSIVNDSSQNGGDYYITSSGDRITPSGDIITSHPGNNTPSFSTQSPTTDTTPDSTLHIESIPKNTNHSLINAVGALTGIGIGGGAALNISAGGGAITLTLTSPIVVPATFVVAGVAATVYCTVQGVKFIRNRVKNENACVWKWDMKHRVNDTQHWDVSDRKGNKIIEVDKDGKEIWPNGPKNKNKNS